MRPTLIQFLEEEILGGTTSIAENDELLLSGLLDSIGVMRLVTFVEETFQLSIPPEDVTIESFSSIATIAKYLEGQQPA